MICYPGAKINIGLNIVSKRNDGFHNIETIFYPIKFCDILEILPSPKNKTNIEISGLSLNIPFEENICIKAYQILQEVYKLPPVEIYLHKIIPSGAGLGGGSSDAASMLILLNELFQLQITNEALKKYAAELGSDCAFFIDNRPAFAMGRGELLEPIVLDLSAYFLYLIKPPVFVSTAEAYRSVECANPVKQLKDLIQAPTETWKETIINDFENHVFKKFPLLAEIKSDLYKAGAIYASMSGSGSTIYGIFNEKPPILKKYGQFINWISND